MYTTKKMRMTRGASAIIVSLGLGLGSAGIAAAGTSHDDHGSDGHHHGSHHATFVEGTVTALGTNTVTISTHNATPVLYTTTATTTYFEGKSAVTVAALATGENVDLWLTATAPQTVTKLAIDLTSFEGKVSAISGNTITLGTSNPRTVNVSATTTYSLKGAASTLSAITVGSWIDASGLLGSNATTLNALSVTIHP